MRLLLLVPMLAVVVSTSGCSLMLLPVAETCVQERNAFTSAQTAQTVSSADALSSSIKAMNAEGAVLGPLSEVGDATRALATTGVGNDPATFERLNQAIAAANAKVATAQAAADAAKADNAKVQAAAAKASKDLADAKDKLDACRQAHPTR